MDDFIDSCIVNKYCIRHFIDNTLKVFPSITRC
jgi:hypothetical protein